MALIGFWSPEAQDGVAIMSRRRVLIVTLHFAPERTGNAPYAAGLASGLAADFDVDVVTAHPHYPEWRVADGYGGWRRTEQVGQVSVHRLQHYLPRHPTGVSRIVSETSFAARTLFPRVPRPDVIVTMTPALAPVAGVLALGRAWDVPVGVIVQDLYSKAFRELGILGGRLDAQVHRVERSLLRQADGVVSIHDRMAEVITRDFGVPAADVEVIPNWTHVTRPSGDRDAMRKSLGWDDGRFTLVHAGNMGAKQGLQHLVPAAKLVDARQLPVRIVVIGNGGQRAELEESTKSVRSLQFMDSLPSDTFMDTLAAADALLLHERPGMKEMCVPSKLTSYFAAARPVLAVTETESAAAHEVRASGAGVVVRPGATEAIVTCIERMRASPLDEWGELGLSYATRLLDESSALARYREWVRSLLAK